MMVVRIVQISSLAGVEPFPSLATYCTVKAARDMQMRVIAEEVEKSKDFSQSHLDFKTLSWAPGEETTLRRPPSPVSLSLFYRCVRLVLPGTQAYTWGARHLSKNWREALLWGGVVDEGKEGAETGRRWFLARGWPCLCRFLLF